ncbi:MAG: zf-TFIIB domain-containing protein [Kiritimatiellales bacterium]|nr:zf-TFIIB domain-containing protein [Kiritimatiellales bacterium]
MQCPKCSNEMKENEHKGIKYDQCKNCGGLWFDALEAEDLVEIKGSADIDTGDAKEGAKLNKKRDINCPVCNIRMSKVHDLQQPHIQLETCAVCKGTFFDAGEFKDFVEEDFMDRIKDRFAKNR